MARIYVDLRKVFLRKKLNFTAWVHRIDPAAALGRVPKFELNVMVEWVGFLHYIQGYRVHISARSSAVTTEVFRGLALS
jgi:hypothetical protein